MLTVDVNDATTGTVLASRMIRKSDILTEYLAALYEILGAPYANYDLSFLLNSYRHRLEYRVWWTPASKTTVSVKKVTVMCEGNY